MDALPRPITVDEFRALPEPPGVCAWELHFGELVPVPRLRLRHSLVQRRILDLLEPMVPRGGFAFVAVVFRLFREFDLRAADVAWISPGRWPEMLAADEVMGATDLVVEIAGKGSTARELQEKRMLCLTHGSREFWVVEPEKRRIDVTHADGSTASCVPGDVIELPLFGPGKSVAVSEIFDLSSY